MFSLPSLLTALCDGSIIQQAHVMQALPKHLRGLELEDAVDRYLGCAEWSDLPALLIDLIEQRPDLEALARTFGGATDGNDERAELASAICRTMRVPSKNDVRIPYGARRVQRELGKVLEALRASRHSATEAPALRAEPLNAWAYVEHVLRTTVSFHAFLLTGIDASTKRDFTMARRQKMLGRLIESMRRLDEQCVNSSDLRAQSDRLFRRPTPFGGFRFDHWKEQLGKRNFYAHSLPELVAELGYDRAVESIELAGAMLAELVDQKISPDVVYVCGEGWDEVGRHYVWVIGEEAVAGYSRSSCRVFTNRPLGDFSRTEAYLVPSLASGRMCEPPMKTLKELGIRMEAASWT
jgi:hypothetical protein